MHPGVSLLQLQGKQKQSARLTMYQNFTTTSHAVLFATDIAARGLDFPSVDWVVQLDAPEDADTYIHRVGRMSRYESKGKDLLFLLPSEEGMKVALQLKGIEVSKIKIDQEKRKISKINFKISASRIQRSSISAKGYGSCFFFFPLVAGFSYIPCSFSRRLCCICDLSICTRINPYSKSKNARLLFAESLGLPGTPKIKFLSKSPNKRTIHLLGLSRRGNLAVLNEQNTIACSRGRIKMCYYPVILNS